MIRDKTLNQLSDMADEEKAFANATFSPFHSAHEGYGVLKEEIEETADEVIAMLNNFEILWETIKENGLGFETIEKIEYHAIRCAAEAIQVAAMCRKYRDSLETDKN